MAEFEVLLQPYQLEPSHAADIGDHCITIDINKLSDVLDKLDEEGELDRVQSVTKLYVLGEWESYFPSDSAQWCKDVEMICGLINEMINLEELTWMSELPFMEMVWEVLPKTLTKLIIDVGRPVRVDQHNPYHKKYISQESMKPLVEFNKLRELRIFGMRDTFQSIIWEAVFRNEADDKGMHVLDLQMAEKPLVREKHWVAANDLQGLKVSNKDGQVYRGVDGKGVLHYEYGTGEYLDDYCMRKARIASKVEEAKPLPLWCVKLDGFVVDQLPFEHELSKVVLLTCGENCIDAGLRAPKTSRAYTWNKWGSSVNNEATHCLIRWPNFAAIFDNEGRLLDPSGNVVGSDNEESSLPFPDLVPLTAERLNLKNLTEALETVKRHDSPTSSPTVAESLRKGPVENFPAAAIKSFCVPASIDDAPSPQAAEMDVAS
ncbi:hypothetical protein K458DRAFT_438286 [Lentithecium fluviatile CBS 122367]|uniref:Uncharacterized protein n=1 Tax=Lentithecium fluviatile CBS 122367 TaxID=1168545 RepID=A0A6G1JN54_9PLEO|nr:hypothetical protein K458DRAFT_438286 [Lentithecium fluviatile CBS 122367]